MFSMPDLGSMWFVLIIWIVCAPVLFVLERLAAADNYQTWESDRPVESALAYLIVLLAGPLILMGLLLWMTWDLKLPLESFFGCSAIGRDVQS
jgi:hypothetical protein